MRFPYGYATSAGGNNSIRPSATGDGVSGGMGRSRFGTAVWTVHGTATTMWPEAP